MNISSLQVSSFLQRSSSSTLASPHCSSSLSSMAHTKSSEAFPPKKEKIKINQLSVYNLKKNFQILSCNGTTNTNHHILKLNLNS